MVTLIFDSQVLPDGHLSCPKEFASKKNVQFKVLVIFEETERESSDEEIEQAAILDSTDEFLSPEEVNYYMNLEDV